MNIWTYMIFFAPFLVLILSGPFAVMATIGSRLGALFNSLPPLNAYAINIAGAIAGSLLFSVLAFTGLSPWQMLVPALLVLLPYLWREGGLGKWAVLPMAASVAVASWAPVYDFSATVCYPAEHKFEHLPKNEVKTFWSPYQRLDVVSQNFVYFDKGRDIVVPLGYNIYSNRRGYQACMDLMPSSFEKYNIPVLMTFLEEYRKRHRFQFQLTPPKDCLVVGAGSGNDVKEALLAGATHVDAVDIDPIILDVGRHMSPAHPYDDPRVNIICDDARHYFNHCQKKYDLIVFAHLDSQSAVGASVRVDNYVYTVQSFKQALTLLKPDGLMVVAFCTMKDWFKDRLYATLKQATGYSPLLINDLRSEWLTANTFFVAGSAVEKDQITLPPSNSKSFSAVKNYNPENARVLTDDWPYLYVTPSRFDWTYLTVVLEIILISLYAGRKVLFSKSRPLDWQMFLMGGAFLLLELQAISRLSLLYGSSWLTSAIVINSVLLMILGSNGIVIKFGVNLAKHMKMLYIILIGTLILSYALPTESILQSGIGGAENFIVTLVTSLPMFMAGIIFSTSFSQSENPRRSLAFNLLGAVYGGLLEYASNYIGVNSLVLIASALYLGSWYFAMRAQSSATTAAVP